MTKKIDVAKILEAAGTEGAARDMGESLGVSRDTISYARRLLKMGTPEQIDLVRSGKVALGVMAKTLPPMPQEIRQTNAPASKKRTLRTEKQRIQGRIYADLKTALELLGSLPAVSDISEAINVTRRPQHAPLRIREAANILGELANAFGE